MSTGAGGDIPKKAIVTVSMNGVFTDPKKFNIPVTPSEMATQAKEAFDQGATVAHIHFRDQHPDKGHIPSWDPKVATEIADAIRDKAPDLLLNFTTGTLGEKGPMGGGPLGPTGGPISCLEVSGSRCRAGRKLTFLLYNTASMPLCCPPVPILMML